MIKTCVPKGKNGLDTAPFRSSAPQIQMPEKRIYLRRKKSRKYMVYINIPYVAENDHIDRDRFVQELTFAEISEDSRHEAYAAVYNRLPRGVNFAIDETDQARSLLK